MEAFKEAVNRRKTSSNGYQNKTKPTNSNHNELQLRLTNQTIDGQTYRLRLTNPSKVYEARAEIEKISSR